MNYQAKTWLTSDSKELNIHIWTPYKDSGKTILMVHGLGEHGGRYHTWAELFVKEGYNFICPDLRGHGKSDGQKGHIKSISVFMEDLDMVYLGLQKMFPKSSVILYGHSLGGNLALNYVIRKNKPFHALITTSPWLRLTTEPPVLLAMLASVLNKILPFISLSNKIDPDTLSHDPEIVRNYISDPLTHDRISVRLFHEATKGGIHALRNVYKINCPYLLMHGKADAITSWQASESYVMNTSNRTRLKLWEGQYHELHNEFIREEVFGYILGWLKEYKL